MNDNLSGSCRNLLPPNASTPYRVVHAQVSAHFLNYSVRHLRPQDEPGAALMGLEVAEGGFDLPPLGVEPGEIGRGSGLGVGDGGQQPVGPILRCALDVALLQGVLDHTDRDRIGVVAARPDPRIDVGRERSITVTFSDGNDTVGFEPPQQIRASRPGLVPECVARG